MRCHGFTKPHNIPKDLRMRLRRIILLDKKQLTVLFVRTFYVAEAQCLNNPNYYEIPAKNEALVKAFLEKYSVESEYDSKIDYLPIAFTIKDFVGFKDFLGFFESGSDYIKTNRYGYVGKYQFGKPLA